jgi:hypothetical protein
MNVCTLNDFLAPFGLPGFVFKRIVNKWTLFPSLRRLVFRLFAPAARKLLQDSDRSEQGGLVFIAASKP